MPIALDDSSTAENDQLPRVGKQVTKLSLLIIDDEADNASVDTGETVVDADGNPDEAHDDQPFDPSNTSFVLKGGACRIHSHAVREHLHSRTRYD